jgi:hypothetical protein
MENMIVELNVVWQCGMVIHVYGLIICLMNVEKRMPLDGNFDQCIIFVEESSGSGRGSTQPHEDN